MKRIHDSLQQVFQRQRLVFWYDAAGDWAETFAAYPDPAETKHEYGLGVTKLEEMRDLDALILAEVYLELSGGRQTAMALTSAPAPRPRAAGEAAPVSARPIALPPRLSEAERLAHAAFVATLGKDAVWGDYAGAARP